MPQEIHSPEWKMQQATETENDAVCFLGCLEQGGGVPEISEIIRKHSLQVGKDFLSKEGLLCWEMAREEQIPFWTQALMHRLDWPLSGIQTCQCRRVYGV